MPHSFCGIVHFIADLHLFVLYKKILQYLRKALNLNFTVKVHQF